MAEGTFMGTKPRMPECNLPSLDQDILAARTGCPTLHRATREIQ